MGIEKNPKDNDNHVTEEDKRRTEELQQENAR